MAQKKMKVGTIVRITNTYYDESVRNKYGQIYITEDEDGDWGVVLETGENFWIKRLYFDFAECPDHLRFLKITQDYYGCMNFKKGYLYIGCQKVNFKRLHELSILINNISAKRHKTIRNAKSGFE
jgi:hypothetical protein